MKLLVGAFALTPLSAMAEEFPAAFSVSGVAANDVLNIRAEPSSPAPLLGHFAPDKLRVEVLETTSDGKWGLVGLPESNGWVSMRYLAPLPDASAPMPLPMVCLGTEPFWSLGLTGPETALWKTPEITEEITLISSAKAPLGYFATLTGSDRGEQVLIVTKEQCFDGMSDRRFGFSARLFQQTERENTLLSGCCTLQAD